MNCEDNSKELLQLKNCIKINVQQPDTCIKINTQGIDRCIKVNSNYSGNCCTPIPTPEFEYIDSGKGQAEYHNQDNAFFSYEDATTIIRITNLKDIIDSGLNWSISTISTPEINLSTGDVSFYVPFKYTGNTTLNSYGFGVTYSDDCGNFVDRIVNINVKEYITGKVYYENTDGSSGFLYPDHFKELFHGNTNVKKIIIYKLPKDDTDWTYMCYNIGNVSYNLKEFIVADGVDTSSVQNLNSSWANCGGLTSFPAIDIRGVTDISNAWASCPNLTSFPYLDTSNVTVAYYAWAYCTGLTSFPALNFSNVTDIVGTWLYCSALTSFPYLNTSNVRYMTQSFAYCSALTSFPHINTDNVTVMNQDWFACYNLPTVPCDGKTGSTFRAYVFDDGVPVPSGDGRTVDCGS